MRLQPHPRRVIVLSSSVDPGELDIAPHYSRPARPRRIRRSVRIGMLLTVIAVRPRWQPLLAAIVLTVLGVIDRHGAGGILIFPALLLLWHAFLIPGDTDADRARRSRLERELAGYSSQAHRCDLAATLDRYPDGLTLEIRDILAGPPPALPSYSRRSTAMSDRRH